MNPLFKLSPLAFAVTLALLPDAQAADYVLTNGQETFKETLIYSIFRPCNALEALIYQGATAGF
ncbi:hypothetical protein [Pseudomonas savastanoi]|uniref:hypothetical protein n=1 Tax=Pseudomonas savastanoi TaxID=29438 RepID=UPI000F216C0E|nr:hypothetical protein [Pseudomonas savastanoi]RML15190.1 hypothetical protein ALR00_103340 [Pseudomonas savastanoi pv. retacarpa]